jgi:type IV secretory pathway TraG/TraD family ATPase VirD4
MENYGKPSTADYFSKKIGKETVWQVTRSKSMQKNAPTPIYGSNNNTKSIGHSEGEQFIGAEFLSVQDFAATPKTRGLVLLENLDFPVMAWMLPYYQESSDQTFLESIYAPHPDHDRDAYEWMKNFLTESNTQPQSRSCLS